MQTKPGRLFSICLLFCLSCLASSFSPNVLADNTFANADFQRVWDRTDKLVAANAASRTWLWGPSPFTAGLQEDYVEAPGGKRIVQYFDKSRMEITNPTGDPTSPYYVTNGLIAVELITGRMQVGDSKFTELTPAEIGVAGDSDDTSGPTYKTLGGLTSVTTEDSGNLITKAIDRAGVQRDGTAEFGQYRVKQAIFEKATGHNIAQPFWDFLNTTGPVLNPQGVSITGRIFDPVYYATGLPITEAWWAKVKVGGQVRDVLVQAFERRVLTFTPSNSAAFQVEMGNIGRHYYEWRYNPANATPTPKPTPTPSPSPSPGPGPTPPGSPGPGSTSCLPASSGVTGDLVQACVDNPTPSKGNTVTVYARLIVGGHTAGGANMNTVWHYKSTTSTCSGTSGDDGVATCSLQIGSATKGYQVKIDVNFTYNGKTYSGETSITPQ